MLVIRDRDNLRISQVLCLYNEGDPLPDLNSDENPYVTMLQGIDTKSVWGVSSQFYACDRRGKILNRSGTTEVLVPLRINTATKVSYIPVTQLNWDDVQNVVGEKAEKYVVYNPQGVLLRRLTRHNVNFIMHDGSHVVGDAYGALYYRPERRCFSVEGKTVNEAPQEILQALNYETP